MTRDELAATLAPIRDFVAGLDLRDAAEAQRALDARFPVDSDLVRALRTGFLTARTSGAICEREANGVRFSRIAKATATTGPAAVSVDAVHMAGPGPGHTHPTGEVDLAFVVDGAPLFDGTPAGWTVYSPGSWHIPTVTGGTMDILYFLPAGAIRFEPAPTSA